MDIVALIDSRGMGRLQVRVLVLCALAALLDGFDLQSIGLAAPGIIATLHVPPHSFGLVFSAALLGLMAGAFGLGPVADRVGRRRILIGALALVGEFTLCTAFATSFPLLLVYRFLAGIGLGGAMPSFISLGSEYTPRRLRAVTAGLLWAGFPLGGMLGGVLGSWLIPAFGWPSIFYVGGALPLLLAIVLMAALPESIGFLVARHAEPARIAALVTRITGTAPAAGTRFILGEEPTTAVSLRQLFSHGRGVGTVLLWIAYFAIFLMLVTNTAWSPMLLHASGMTVARAALAMAAFNAGSVVGTSLAGVLITRFEACLTLALLCVASTLSVGLVGEAAPSFAGIAVLQGLSGLLLGAASSGLIAVAALSYPIAMRSTGVGWAMGMGRFGSFTGPLLIGTMVSTGYGIAAIYLALGTMALVAAGSMVALGWQRRRSEASAMTAAESG